MKWLVDAQLPIRLAQKLRALGHDAVHTLDLPDKNRTADNDINRIAAEENRIVVSKDSDFVDSHLINGVPPQLLSITTGNIRNTDLLHLFELHMPAMENAFTQSYFVELGTGGIVVHG